MRSGRSVLAVGAHPDDIELGCFGTIARWSVEHDAKATFVVLTDGEDGGPRDRRCEEARASAELVNAQLVLGGLRSASLSSEFRSAIELIEKAIACSNPDVIFTHTNRDRHQDHRAAAEATFSAARRAPSDILLYDTTRGFDGFDPRYFVDISDAFPSKLKALSLHASQAERAYCTEDAVKAQAVDLGARIGTNRLYEGFEVRRMFDR